MFDQSRFKLTLGAALLLLTAQANGITIQFDYSLDGPFPFFGTEEKKKVLEAAADVYEQLLADHLAAIEPSGDDWWRVSIPNPSTGGLSLQRNMTIPEDTIRIFVGGRDLPEDDIGSVDIGVVGGSGSDQWASIVQERGQANAIGVGATDFGHWGGAMAFDNKTPFAGPRKWHFDVETLPGPDEYDFYTAALHEIPKVLGIGTADSWDTWTDFDLFEFHGPAVVEALGGPVPLDDSDPDNLTHFASGTSSTAYPGGQPQVALNTRVLPAGMRKQLTKLDVAVLRDIGWEIVVAGPQLQAGDADQDGDFDQLDIVQVLQAAKYLTGEPATWGEGDWNGAPGGSPGTPPPGDGVFNQLDIITVLGGCYGSYQVCGPYAALAPGSAEKEGQTSIIYDARNGEVAVDTPAGRNITSINITSVAGILTGDPAQNLGGSFDHDTDHNLFKSVFNGIGFGSLRFGHVARPGLSEQFVLDDLSVVGSLASGGPLGDVDLVYIPVPEPATVILLVTGWLGLVIYPRLRVARRPHATSLLITLVLGTVCGAPARAVILADVDGTGNTTLLPSPNDPGWSNVGKYGDFSATYLGNRWAIAADHVELATVIKLGSVTVAVEPGSEITLRNPAVSELPDYAAGLIQDGTQLTEFTDLRLIRLAEDPGLPALTISTEPPPFLDEPTEIVIIGHGLDRQPDLSMWEVEEVGGGQYIWEEVEGPAFNVSGYKYATTQTKRWGTNTIVADALAQWEDHDVFTLVTQFNDDPLLDTEFESQASKGDSGGAVFYENDGTWELVGIMLGVGNAVAGQPPDTAVFGNFTVLADLSIYRDQILDLTSRRLMAGDANQNLSFDQFDIVQVLLVDKYLSGQPATWSEGDWNGAPGGTPGNPPLGDGVFDQRDIIAALAPAHYRTGPYAALLAGADLKVATVPEPPANMLVAVALLSLLIRSWRPFGKNYSRMKGSRRHRT